MTRIAELLDGPEVARAILRSLVRDLRVQVRNGLPIPEWANPVLSELQPLLITSRSLLVPVSEPLLEGWFLVVAEGPWSPSLKLQPLSD